MNKKIILAALVGGIAFFFAGWLLYGILLADFTTANFNQCMARKMEDMVWWAIIASNLSSALFIAIIFYWTKTTTLLGGIKMGAFIGLFTGLGFDLSFHSMNSMFQSEFAILIDVGMGTLMSALAGGLIALVLGSGKEKAA